MTEWLFFLTPQILFKRLVVNFVEHVELDPACIGKTAEKHALQVASLQGKNRKTYTTLGNLGPQIHLICIFELWEDS